MTSKTLTSMTGFARVSGTHAQMDHVWELKSVNGKALDIRFRVPAGFDALELPARQLAAAILKRGNIQVTLTVQTVGAAQALKVNHEVLDQLVAIAEKLRAKLGSPPIRVEELLSLRGVLEAGETTLDEDAVLARDKLLLASFGQALTQLALARNAEGDRLSEIINAQLLRIEALTAAARDNPSRKPEAIRQRLADQVARIMEEANSLDPQRLHQEAILLATRADIQEELDRLSSHITATRQLLNADEPVGRKLDFLAQEFNREANTLCSKANDPSLTTIGLDLKTVIDQMREQIQNIE